MAQGRGVSWRKGNLEQYNTMCLLLLLYDLIGLVADLHVSLIGCCLRVKAYRRAFLGQSKSE